MKIRKCSVKGCSSFKRNPTISFFKPPKANYSAWKSAVSNANCEETIVKFVCAEHFRPDDILTSYLVPHDIPNVSITFFISYIPSYFCIILLIIII